LSMGGGSNARNEIQNNRVLQPNAKVTTSDATKSTVGEKRGPIEP